MDFENIIIGTSSYDKAKSGNLVSITGDGGVAWNYFGSYYKKLAPRLVTYEKYMEGLESLSNIKDKEEYAENILSQMNKADIEIETVLEKVDGIKSAMVDVEEKRKVFMDKISSLEKDFNKIEKNDKKVQLFLNKLEELNIILEEMQNQRENLNYMKKENDNIVKNLERAEYFVRYLQDLLDNAEKYMSDGKTTSKRSKSNIVDNKKEEFIIKMYKQGWKTDEIVKNSSYSIDEVETIIKKWKDKQSRG